jgi:uncharacterized protein YndB with AHSA1/START domain
MSLQTTRTLEIGAPPAEVFTWLVEPDKLKAWTDAESKFPADGSQLRVGFKLDGTFEAPDGQRQFSIEVTAYDPPRALGYVETYAGGKSTVTYRLSESPTGTAVETAMSADQAAPVTTVPDAVMAQLAQLPEMQRKMAEEQMANAMKQMASYDSTANPQVAEAWEKKVDAELEKLKELVELVQKERRG